MNGAISVVAFAVETVHVKEIFAVFLDAQVGSENDEITWLTASASMLISPSRTSTSRFCKNPSKRDPVLVRDLRSARLGQDNPFCFLKVPAAFTRRISITKVAPMDAEPAFVAFLQRLLINWLVEKS